MCGRWPTRERGRPARTMPGAASAISSTWIDPERRRGVFFGLAVAVPADLVAACQVALTLSNLHKAIRMRAGRPRSRGDPFPLMGWGDGRVGAGDRYFFINIDAQDAQDFFRKRLACNPGYPQSPTGPSPEPASSAGTSRPVYPVHPVHRCGIIRLWRRVPLKQFRLAWWPFVVLRAPSWISFLSEAQSRPHGKHAGGTPALPGGANHRQLTTSAFSSSPPSRPSAP